jgi:hypothetical protein
VHHEPVAKRRLHTSRFVRRVPYEKRPALPEATRIDDQTVTEPADSCESAGKFRARRNAGPSRGQDESVDPGPHDVPATSRDRGGTPERLISGGAARLRRPGCDARTGPGDTRRRVGKIS